MGAAIAEAAAFGFDVEGTVAPSDDPNVAGGRIHVLPGDGEVPRWLRERRTPFVCFITRQ